MPLAIARPRRGRPPQHRVWLERFGAPAPSLAGDLLDRLHGVLGSGPDDRTDVHAYAAALGVLRVQQGHAISTMVEDLAALRWLLLCDRPAEAVTVHALVDGVLAHATAGYVDELAATLTSKATRDPLTGMPNRAAFTEAMHHEVTSVGRGNPPALLLIDLDGFKAVNDTDGHLAGDAVLCGVAALLGRTVRNGDIACRLGGDEFAVVLPRTSQRQAVHAARRLLTASRGDAALASDSARVTLSLGLGWVPDPRSVEELLAVADAALYRVKATGGNGFDASRPDDRPDTA